MSSGSVALSPICNEPVLSPGYFHSQPGPWSSESILIYLTVSGSLTPIRVLESDSIESVKLRIQTCKGFVVKNQKLVHGGKELSRSNSLIRDYGIADGNVLHLVLRLSDLQVINVKTVCGKELTFQVERCRDIGYIKEQISKKEKDLVDLDDQELVCNGECLEDQRCIDDICKNNDAVVHLLVRKSAKVRAKPVQKNFELSIDASHKEERRHEATESSEVLIIPRKPPDRECYIEPFIVNPKVELPSIIWDLINSTFDGLDRGKDPVRSLEGTGGAYFMQDSCGNSISVFKPIDEEPMAVNNPRGLPLSPDGEGLKRGTRVSEGALREVAAYILDHPKSGRRSFSSEVKGFAGVPPTVMVKCLHDGFNHPEGITVKIGSLQMFMKNCGSCEDMGPGSFPVEEVHKITVLDMRLANADRHAGNILVSKEGKDGRTVLIPIDHGYCLPESFEDCTFDWLNWPQACEPYSPDTIDYIKSLDAEQDIGLLNFYGWELPPECARILHISTMLLKKGAERGFTPFVIGNIMCRKNMNTLSEIEEIVQEAHDSVIPDCSEATFLESVSQIMDRHLDATSSKGC